MPQDDQGDQFADALREVWGAAEKGGALAAWLGGLTFSLSPCMLEYTSIEIPEDRRLSDAAVT